MTQADQDRARIATDAIYDLGAGIIGPSSPFMDQRATTRALVAQELLAALVDALNLQGTYKTDAFDYFAANRLEALRGQLQALASANGAAPKEAEAGDEVSTLGRFPGPPPPPPGQLPNPYLAKFPLASPPDPVFATALPAPPADEEPTP